MQSTQLCQLAAACRRARITASGPRGPCCPPPTTTVAGEVQPGAPKANAYSVPHTSAGQCIPRTETLLVRYPQQQHAGRRAGRALMWRRPGSCCSTSRTPRRPARHSRCWPRPPSAQRCARPCWCALPQRVRPVAFNGQGLVGGLAPVRECVGHERCAAATRHTAWSEALQAHPRSWNQPAPLSGWLASPATLVQSGVRRC